MWVLYCVKSEIEYLFYFLKKIVLKKQKKVKYRIFFEFEEKGLLVLMGNNGISNVVEEV